MDEVFPSLLTLSMLFHGKMLRLKTSWGMFRQLHWELAGERFVGPCVNCGSFVTNLETALPFHSAKLSSVLGEQ